MSFQGQVPVPVGGVVQATAWSTALPYILLSQTHTNTLNRNISRQEAGEAATHGEEMDHEVITTPTDAAQVSLQNMALEEKS